MAPTLATRAFQVLQHAGLTKVPGSFTKPDALPDGSPQPKVDNDLFGKMNIEQNITASDGPTFTYDVFPDLRYILLYLIFFITKEYKNLEQRDDPYLSPASLLAYCLTLVYAHLLTCDRYIRIKPSPACKEYIDDPDRKRYHQHLLNSWIPPFVADLIEILTPTNDPRRPGIEYIPTAACFTPELDFGRFFPITMFTKFHDILARTTSRAEPHALYSTWFDFEVYDQTPVAQIFGIDPTGTNSIYEHWLYQAIVSLMNPVTSRYIANRPVFSRIPTLTISNDTENRNPYTILLGSTDDNLMSLTSWLKTMSTHAKEHLNAKLQLGACYDDLVGTTIMIHTVSEPSLPTWHRYTHKTSTKDAPSEQTVSDYQKKLKWLINNEFTAPSTPLTFPNLVSDAVKNLLRLTKNKYDPDVDMDKYIIFDKKTHVTPRQRIFDPYDYSASKSAFPIVSGLRIESFELDGFEVPLPNMRNSLATDNSQALQGCIPATQLSQANIAAPVSVILRSPEDEYEQKSSLSLYDMSRNRIARAPLDIMNPDSTTIFSEDTIPRDWSLLINKFAWRFNESTRKPTLPRNFVNGWSSYRHLTSNKAQSKLTRDDILVLMTFRPQFGTNITMFEVEHGSRAIPRA